MGPANRRHRGRGALVVVDVKHGIITRALVAREIGAGPGLGNDGSGHRPIGCAIAGKTQKPQITGGHVFLESPGDDIGKVSLRGVIHGKLKRFIALKEKAARQK